MASRKEQTEPSPTTSTEDPLSQDELLAVKEWNKRIGPSRQRNLTPLQRKQLAKELCEWRQARSGKGRWVLLG